MIWHVSKQAQLTIEEWDDSAVVYSSLSGETHLLNSLACEILKLLQVESGTIATLIGKVCVIFEVEDKVDLEQQIGKLIGDFENLGLIESIQREN